MCAEKVFVLCDGTWCGYKAESHTNLEEVYERLKNAYQAETVKHFEGIGQSGNLLDKLLNGASGFDVKDKCVEAYQFIVENYNPSKELWLLGLSRGAFTVRSVAGMINNFGILDLAKLNNARVYNSAGGGDAGIKAICSFVYDLYRNKSPVLSPKGYQAKEFFSEFSHKVERPIKFMGLFDTVGALGIPSLAPGAHVEYEFYDTNVSSVVEHVYQVCAIHDRLAFFQHCPISRSKTNKALTAEEFWVPGCHYDIGRQTFSFAKALSLDFLSIPLLGVSVLSRKGMHGLRELFAKTIVPQREFAEIALDWMLEKMIKHGVRPCIKEAVPVHSDQPDSEFLRSFKKSKTLSGDVYGPIENLNSIQQFIRDRIITDENTFGEHNTIIASKFMDPSRDAPSLLGKYPSRSFEKLMDLPFQISYQ